MNRAILGAVTQSGWDRPVPEEALSVDDRSALGWAVSSEHALGVAILGRGCGGGSGVTVGELAAIRRNWEDAGRPTPERHVHRSPVAFVDGTTVTAVSFLADDPYTREVQPTFGLYLDSRWAPPWPHVQLDWPDFGVPTDVVVMRSALLDLLQRARSGESVELGCLGGHGRTGTALACLTVLAGTSPTEAVEWVRKNYCPKAVETESQETLVRSFSG